MNNTYPWNIPVRKPVEEVACPTCRGTGVTWPQHSVTPKPSRCRNCGGTGYLPVEEG